MPAPTEDDIARIDEKLKRWQQGDLLLKPDLPFLFYAHPALQLTPAAQQTEPDEQEATLLVESIESGFVVVSQTCDIVISCRKRPYVELSPLVSADKQLIKETRTLRRSTLAYHPAAASNNLVVDLERTMTIEKALLVEFDRVVGLRTDAETTTFADALAKRRSRFAYPDDFVAACSKFSEHVKKKAKAKNRDHDTEWLHIDAIDEIRVMATPNWSGQSISLSFWMIKRGDPASPDWPGWTKQWAALVDQTGRYQSVSMHVATLGAMTALDYQTSHHFDFDQLSISVLP
jgi:hypothetical protein